jgi:exodeoxyribonuclease-5
MNYEEIIKRRDRIIANFQLTDCQYAAITDIIDWLVNTDAISWTLSGAAGTGKSFTTKLLKDILPYNKICISAPTHKALRVTEEFTEIQGETLHKLLGLRPNFDLKDFDIHNPKFDQMVDSTMYQYDLVLIDEASMIQSDLFTHIMNEASAHRVRVLFIGDMHQLPPVDKNDNPENISQAFNLNEIGGMSVLKTPARQNTTDPHYLLLTALRANISKDEQDYTILLELAKNFGNNKLYDIITDKNSRGIEFSKIIKNCKSITDVNGNGYTIFDDYSRFCESMLTNFCSPYFKDDPRYCRLVAYTNNSVVAWNNYLRQQILDTDDVLVEGDVIMAYSTIYDSYMKPLIINSNEYYVNECFNDHNSATIRKGGILVDYDINYIFTKITDVYRPLVNTHVNILRPSYENFKKVHSFYLNEGVKQKRWQQYYRFKNNFLLLGDIPEDKDYKLPKKDFDYAFALTIHKSQGSTFQYAYTSILDILKHSEYGLAIAKKKGTVSVETANSINQTTLKLAYVALSRAKRFVGIYYNK